MQSTFFGEGFLLQPPFVSPKHVRYSSLTIHISCRRRRRRRVEIREVSCSQQQQQHQQRARSNVLTSCQQNVVAGAVVGGNGLHNKRPIKKELLATAEVKREFSAELLDESPYGSLYSIGNESADSKFSHQVPAAADLDLGRCLSKDKSDTGQAAALERLPFDNMSGV